MVCGMFVCVSISVNVCMFTMSNALFMSNATAIVRVGGMGWVKPVATLLSMLCSAVFVEFLVLNPCCVVMFGMFVCVSLSVNVCMFTMSNALLMSNATAIVRVGGMGWLKPVATVLLMLCNAVFVECLVLNPCCAVMFGMFCVMYG